MLQPARHTSMFPDLEFVVLRPPRHFVEHDIASVFPEAPKNPSTFYGVVTFQPSLYESLIPFSDGAQDFKDVSRERFLRLMDAIQQKFLAPCQDKERWMDWVDPATGLAFHSAAGSCCIYSETDAIEQLLFLDVVHVAGSGGGCRCVVHPKYGLDVYPATAFLAGSSPEDVLSILNSM